MLSRMGRTAQFDTRALANLLARQHDVLSRRQAAACALTQPAIRYRIRPGGPWQAILPGVYLTNRGEATGKQRAMAAYLYAGKPIAITGPMALAWHSIAAAKDERVDVLVPPGCRRADAGFARMRRTSVVPEQLCRDGAIYYAPLARAVADTARQLGSIADVRAVVASAVQRKKVEVWQLAKELDLGPKQGSALLRIALEEVADGVRSAAEADLLLLVRLEHLPMPLFNPRLYVAGEFLAMPDAWWPEAGLVVEVDSREWHLSPADWERTMLRHGRMTAQGILLLHYAPRRIRYDRQAVAAEIRAAYARGLARQLPQIETRPSAVALGRAPRTPSAT